MHQQIVSTSFKYRRESNHFDRGALGQLLPPLAGTVLSSLGHPASALAPLQSIPHTAAREMA